MEDKERGTVIPDMGLRDNNILICVRCNSVTMEESAIVQNCRGIGRLVVMCKIGVIAYLVGG
jgi:hypothetical protein